MDDLQQCEVKAGTLAMRAYDLLRQEIVSGRVVEIANQQGRYAVGHGLSLWRRVRSAMTRPGTALVQRHPERP